ncbi:hypothetical protein [Nocardiopsis sp. SBT366]|jgi:hypothetical protein|uniref:hypothetical protein n=1 Tax=Nocardiopsis sp. SBT366 TaxID=1580529 RepID=UPI00066E25E9|nr:hypothetical protein [Nocardiopsis sp. SBT366]
MSPASPTARKKSKGAQSASDRRARKRQAEENDGQEPTAADQADQNGAKPSIRARTRARLGEKGMQSLVVAARAGLIFSTCFAVYVLAMFIAVTVVPNVFLMVATGTGIGPAAPLEMQLAHWLAPSLFLIGLIFVLVLVVARWLWRAQRRLGEKARRALLGEEAGR